MRTRIVASAAAATVLLMNVAGASPPLQAQSSNEVKAMALADIAASAKRPLICVA